MEKINDIKIFVKVIEKGSFSAAALELLLPKSTVSRRISRLEKRLGVQLLIRTTRRLDMTGVGEIYYERCKQIVLDIEEAEAIVKLAHNTPCGRLKVTGPIDVNRTILAHSVTSFMQKYSEVSVEVVSTNRCVNLSEEGFDIAIRAGKMDDSSLMSRQLISNEIVLVGSSDYLKKKGKPKSLKDFKQHDCLVLEGNSGRRCWYASDGTPIPLKGRLISNNLSVLYRGVLGGLGLTLLPLPMVQSDLDAGRLQSLMPELMSVRSNLSILYRPGHHLSANVRAFVDHTVEFFKGHRGNIF